MSRSLFCALAALAMPCRAFVHMNGEYAFANQRPGQAAKHRGTGISSRAPLPAPPASTFEGVPIPPHPCGQPSHSRAIRAHQDSSKS